MRLSELMDGEGGIATIAPPGDPEIRGLSLDSRRVEDGFVFAALPGTKTDGKQFVDDAVARGAVVILTDDPKSYDALTRRTPPVTVVGDPNPRRRIARMAARFYRPQPETVAAVTGTNGKTSVTVFTAPDLAGHGLAGGEPRHHRHRRARLRAARHRSPRPTRSRCIPSSTRWRKAASIMSRIEASSHGLDQFRLDGLKPKAAAFTNLTRDHLDYHHDMAAYLAAKTRLFTELLARDGTAVINLDDETGAELALICAARGQHVIGYGRHAKAALRLVAAQPDRRRPGIDARSASARATRSRCR